MNDRWKDFFFNLTHWGLNSHPVHSAYSDWLMDQLSKPNPLSNRTGYTVDVAGHKIWIGNYPYGFGNIYDREPRVLPTKRVRKILYDMLVGAPE